MRNGGRVVHGPLVRWLCVAAVTAGGLICLGFAVALPWILGPDDPGVEDWLAGLDELWPFVGCLAGVGLLQLAFAGWGVWSWRSAEGAG